MEEKIMNIYQKLQKCRVALQSKEIKKSNYNEFGKYAYFDLGDFLPFINELCEETQLSNIITYGEDAATLKHRNTESLDETLEFTTKMVVTPLKGCSEMQSIGAAQTYARKYLYFTAFEIAETDALDSGDTTEDEEKVFMAKKIDITKLETIKTMLHKTNSDEKMFLKYFKLNSIEDITNGQFKSVMGTLETKKREIESKQKKVEEIKQSSQIDLGI